MNLNIFSWNVRGLNDSAKRARVCNLLSIWKIDIVCFQETKLTTVSQTLVPVFGDVGMLTGLVLTLLGLPGELF